MIGNKLSETLPDSDRPPRSGVQCKFTFEIIIIEDKVLKYLSS